MGRVEKRRWWIVAALVGSAAIALWVLLRLIKEPEDPTWERILDSGILLVCTDPSWPPFEALNSGTGQIEGFDADLALLLAERLAPGTDVGAKFVSMGFDGLYDGLQASRCDMIVSALPHEPLRVEDVAYSVAYFNAGQVLVVAEDRTAIQELEDLQGRTVGVEWGFVPEGDARQRALLRDLAVVRYETGADVLRALQAGAVEVAIVDRITLFEYTRECKGLRMIGEPIYDVNYVIPVRPDSPRLLKGINRVLLEMREDGTLEILQDRWF
jgi:polar amino acid transport system substrate-binding protein